MCGLVPQSPKLTLPCFKEDCKPKLGLSSVDGRSEKLKRRATPADRKLMHTMARVRGHAIAVDPATDNTGHLTMCGEETERHGKEVAVKRSAKGWG